MVKYTEMKNYENYGRALKISNGTIEAIVTTDIGPRIIFFGYCGGHNMLHNDLERAGKWDGEEYDAYFWKGAVSYLYGGHRIWITPERKPETNYPDNDPVEVTYEGKSVIFTAPAQKKNDIKISIAVTMADEGTRMDVSNRVMNVRDTDQEFAVWTISVMHDGGLEVFKHADNDRGLLYNRIIALWSYSSANDYRFYNGKRFMTVKQDPSGVNPFKMGTNNRDGKAVYALGDDVFLKRYTTDHDNLTYPDGGVSFETYTNERLLELEVLGPVQTVKPGETAVLDEVWEMAENPGTPDPHSDDEIADFWNKVWKN